MKDYQAYFKIDRQSRMPLYELIEQNLRELITKDKLKPGDPIPSEWELADLYRVSRLTVRHAMDNLSRQGWLIRRHGVGSFAASPSVARITPSKLSFTEQMRAIGRAPSSRQLSIQIMPAPAEIASSLGLQEGDPVTEITRLRMADNEPILLEKAYVSNQRFPEITPESDFSNSSLYEYLSSQHQMSVSLMDQTIEPVLITKDEAECLDVPAGAPAIQSKVVSYTNGGDPVECSWSVTRGDRCKFYFRFRREE
jgi:GntR family transcriptional regulator